MFDLVQRSRAAFQIESQASDLVILRDVAAEGGLGVVPGGNRLTRVRDLHTIKPGVDAAHALELVGQIVGHPG